MKRSPKGPNGLKQTPPCLNVSYTKINYKRNTIKRKQKSLHKPHLLFGFVKQNNLANAMVN